MRTWVGPGWAKIVRMAAATARSADEQGGGNGIARQALPRFVRPGDRFLVSELAKVRNTTRIAVATKTDLASPERVYQVLRPGLRLDFPALRSLETTPNNLPVQLTSFVGRAEELALLRRWVAW